MAGTTKSLKQSLASGHLDMMCASNRTSLELFPFEVAAACGGCDVVWCD